MISQLPPGPFRWTTTAYPGDHDGIGHVYLHDRIGRKIASIWGKPDEKVALANFIVGNAEISARAIAFERAFALARTILIDEGLDDFVASIQNELIKAGITRLHCVKCDGLGEYDEGPLPARHHDQVSPDYKRVVCPDCNGVGSIKLGAVEL